MRHFKWNCFDTTTQELDPRIFFASSSIWHCAAAGRTKTSHPSKSVACCVHKKRSEPFVKQASKQFLSQQPIHSTMSSIPKSLAGQHVNVAMMTSGGE